MCLTSFLAIENRLNIFMTARGKERLVYDNFTYYKQSRTRSGFRWGCTKNRWHRCKAYLHLADDLTIVRSNMVHTHPACYSTFITLTRGSKLLMYQNYTYFKSGPIRDGGFRYTCSSSQKQRCKAYLHVNKDNVIVFSTLAHNHLPQRLMKTHSGLYLKRVKFAATFKEYFVLAIYITPSKLHFCEEYTYFRSGAIYRGGWRFWKYSCSCMDSKNCEAHVYIHKDDIIITNTQHNHLPLEYVKTKTGLYLQV
ncbi:uncharacterized protein LOC120627071 [Pararge aegeria]|uniref:uncharacterized protein LOC120627071 n=1 Tax=Pararge aegeria TaxID=116150 RepID=UPI0019D2557E|nr:uncharacterized protein LOC120627071 [Pararge aegeria]